MRLFNWNREEQEQQAPRRKKRGCLYSFLVFTVIYMLLSMIMGEALLSEGETTVEDNSVYMLELKGVVVEQAAEENPLEALMNDWSLGGEGYEKKVGLDQLISNIRLAKTNDKIKGICLSGGELQAGLASAKAIRDELIAFKASGKFIIAHADNYGELSYYIASVADRVYVSPVGMIEWHGFGSIKLYYPRLMEKLGIKMNVLKVGTFKSAVEPYFCTQMSEADKKQTMRYIGTAWQQVCKAVGESRGISAETLNEYADELMELQAQERYVQYHMVDSLVYRYDMDTLMEQLYGVEEFKYLNTAQMAKVKREKNKQDSVVAVVYAEGEIFDKGKEGISAKKMAGIVKYLEKDKDVCAVVLRVNSPGGSADASEQIWYALQQLKAKGLPLVVSMGDYAASGGYYISSGADWIFAEPNTLTGSIGIFGLVPDVSGLRHRIGIDIDGVGTNKFSTSHMMLKGMTRDEQALMQSMVERGYDLFTRRCAEGRHMKQDAIKEIAEGRVWIGTDAMKIGLVDEMGNLDDAIVKAAELAGVEHYSIAYHPARKDFWEELLQQLENPTDEEKIMAKLKERFKEQRMMALMPDQIVY